MRCFRFAASLALGLILSCARAIPSQAAEIRVIAANAVKDGYGEIVAAFEKATGHTVRTTWAGTVAAAKRVGDGEVFDLVIIASANIDQLIAAGKLIPGSRADFAKTGVAMAVRAGLPRPDVATPEGVRQAVLAARSLAYSGGPSGAYVVEMLRRMGIADQAAAKAKQPSSGAEVAALLAKGEVDFAFAQVSEFMGLAGVEPLGPLPPALQNYTIYAIGLGPSAGESARALVRHLTAPDAAGAIRRMGMEPG